MGSKFYDKLSKDLVKELPNVTVLSHINLRYMEKFYLLYKEQILIVPQLVGQLEIVPWGHHRCIIDRCKNIGKAIYFINKTIENNLSIKTLLNFLNTNSYKCYKEKFFFNFQDKRFYLNEELLDKHNRYLQLRQNADK